WHLTTRQTSDRGWVVWWRAVGPNRNRHCSSTENLSPGSWWAGMNCWMMLTCELRPRMQVACGVSTNLSRYRFEHSDQVVLPGPSVGDMTKSSLSQVLPSWAPSCSMPRLVVRENGGGRGRISGQSFGDSLPVSHFVAGHQHRLKGNGPSEGKKEHRRKRRVLPGSWCPPKWCTS